MLHETLKEISKETSKVRTIGIDPGTRFAGYGIVESYSGRIYAIAAGGWRLNKNNAPLPERLGRLVCGLREVVQIYQPHKLCLELSFLADNPKTALYLGHARGAILAEAFQLNLEISEISATSAKKIITGHGRSDKKTVAQVMSSLLGFQLEQLPLDATDALAIAYADATKSKLISLDFKF